MNTNARPLRRLKTRRFPTLMLALALTLATGGIALAATSYSGSRDNRTAPAAASSEKARDCGHPHGCVFPAAAAFAGR